MKPYLPFVLVAVAVVARAEDRDRVSVESTTIAAGKSYAVNLTRTVIRAEIVPMKQRGEVRIDNGSAVLSCPPPTVSKEIEKRAALFPGCLIEVAAGSSGELRIDRGVRNIEAGSESVWFKIERRTSSASSP